jgi:hypothetical protein
VRPDRRRQRRFATEIDLGVWIMEDELCEEFDDYREARAIAADIAAYDKLDSDLVFSDALHVAVALALQDAGFDYSKANVAWMVEQVSPAEVREVLLYRRDNPEDYPSLPKAGAVESLTAAQVEAAHAVTEMLGSDQLNAMFFSDSVGTA